MSMTYQKEIPITGDYDVTVIGGGPAGLLAATAAAKNGARVALGEAAGTAAALCIREKCGTTVLNIPLLREALLAQGAII